LCLRNPEKSKSTKQGNRIIMIVKKVHILFILGLMLAFINDAHSQVLDKQKMLDRFDFWQNKDWDWYKENIPFFESPDSEIDITTGGK
jgi:esterase/lipase superfamily enzyme